MRAVRCIVDIHMHPATHTLPRYSAAGRPASINLKSTVNHPLYPSAQQQHPSLRHATPGCRYYVIQNLKMDAAASNVCSTMMVRPCAPPQNAICHARACLEILQLENENCWYAMRVLA